MTNTLKHIAFYIDGTEDKFDYVEDLVKQHDITEYLISHELKNSKDEDKPHFHIIILTDEKTYANFIKKLRNALDAYNKVKGSGGYRPYGRIKQPIRDIHKLKVYCSKDGNVRSSYSAEVLEALYKESHKKNAVDAFKEELIKTLDEIEFDLSGYDVKDKLYQTIIKMMIKNDMKISRPGVVSWGNFYISKTERYNINQKARFIYNICF